MADYYTQFSLVVEGTPEQLADLFRVLTGEEGNEEGYTCDVDKQENYLWLHSWEYCDLERVSLILAKHQEKYHLVEPIVLSWANTCSKLRPDGFGGGSVVIYKGNVVWFNPQYQATNWIEAQKEA